MAVAGVSGAGKTTLAGRVADVVRGRHVEIDGLYHGADWTPRASFVDDVRELVAGDSWTTELRYRIARPLLAERADLVVWLDLPFWTTVLPRAGAPSDVDSGVRCCGTAMSSPRCAPSSPTVSMS
ncbi:hypothetical protein BKD30_07925 [Tersicoccus phoenicis]|uniref:Uncharacterized protein n=1 Tax=Tersicoccus phoenicis TaxID=554083 RepID=A0A1R1LAX6_9MICC|nr:hypothetical protein [Tersicoccus phoenicis]OMH24690.1 hypothetical protein BKD30_07925 [Tersicoccus phoenicis]